MVDTSLPAAVTVRVRTSVPGAASAIRSGLWLMAPVTFCGLPVRGCRRRLRHDRWLRSVIAEVVSLGPAGLS